MRHHSSYILEEKSMLVYTTAKKCFVACFKGHYVCQFDAKWGYFACEQHKGGYNTCPIGILISFKATRHGNGKVTHSLFQTLLLLCD